MSESTDKTPWFLGVAPGYGLSEEETERFYDMSQVVNGVCSGSPSSTNLTALGIHALGFILAKGLNLPHDVLADPLQPTIQPLESIIKQSEHSTGTKTDEQLHRYSEREKQLELAEEHGQVHIGGDVCALTQHF